MSRPLSFETDPRGLLIGVDYQFRPDGSVNWRRLIEAEFLGIKREYEEEVLKANPGKTLAEVDKTQLEDHQLLVLIGGWQRLLFARGYTSLTNPCTFVTPEKAVATCTITFVPVFETRMQPVTFSWTASASYANTSGDIPQAFLESTACNRAFSLCLRKFLNVNIVGNDEIGPSVRRGKGATDTATQPGSNQPSSQSPSGFSPSDTLQKRCVEKGLSFDQFKIAALNHKSELNGDPTKWAQYSDVEGPDAWTLLGKLKAAEEKSKKPAK